MEPLGRLHKRLHKRSDFFSGVDAVDQWLKTGARQSQEKRLSVTRVLVKTPDCIAGFYTLAMGEVSFDELPHEMARRLSATLLPIVTLAWLGLAKPYQGQGLGGRLPAQALSDCHSTGLMMPYVAVCLDCASRNAKTFYQLYDFQELPGHPMTLMLPWNLLEAMMKREARVSGKRDRMPLQMPGFNSRSGHSQGFRPISPFLKPESEAGV